jgi:hypothetical protein
MPHDAHSKEKFISGLKLERVKKILCDAHNSVASRDALTRQRGEMALLRRFGRPSRQPVIFRRDPCTRGNRSAYQQAGRAGRRCHAADTWRASSQKDRPDRSGRSMECLARSFGNHRPRWALEHYQDVIFGSNAMGPEVAFLPRLLLIRNGEIDNCACIIFHLASQQASGTIHVPYVMPSRCEAL